MYFVKGDICKTVRGKQWICRQIRQCPKAMQMLQSGGRPEVCRYAGVEPVVCCEPSTSPNPPRTTKKPKPITRKPTPTPTSNAGLKARQSE